MRRMRCLQICDMAYPFLRSYTTLVVAIVLVLRGAIVYIYVVRELVRMPYIPSTNANGNI
ncbi:hypothetical protein PENNAL_c0800G02454, partial [Penicillium nalgiovense]